MSRVRSAVVIAVPVLLLASACSDLPTAASRPPITPITAEPSQGIFTPLLLPAGADWGHYFVSFDPDRHLSVEVVHYPDGSVTGRGIFIVPGARTFGTLRVTRLVNTFDGCTPYSTPCTGAPGEIPESSTVSGVGLIGAIPLTFTLVLDSHLWPPPGTGPPPSPNPGTDYDVARLTVCVLGTCTETEFKGELHHEPT
jgi:hypothetical protein